MAKLAEVIAFCDKRVRREEIEDFPGAFNGLQVENNGEVTRIGAAVDAGLDPFRKAKELGVDFLIVHHGLFWSGTQPVTGAQYEKVRTLLDGNMAVYGSHLPLDGHPEIGNNAVIARKLGLKHQGWFLHYEGTPIGMVAEAPESRASLRESLMAMFPETFMGIEYGSETPSKIAICSGSGAAVIDEMIKSGIDTLVTGELRQHQFNIAQEHRLNLYPCGHYATEVFGVQELAREVAEKFGLPWDFIGTECLL